MNHLFTYFTLYLKLYTIWSIKDHLTINILVHIPCCTRNPFLRGENISKTTVANFFNHFYLPELKSHILNFKDLPPLRIRCIVLASWDCGAKYKAVRQPILPKILKGNISYFTFLSNPCNRPEPKDTAIM